MKAIQTSFDVFWRARSWDGIHMPEILREKQDKQSCDWDLQPANLSTVSLCGCECVCVCVCVCVCSVSVCVCSVCSVCVCMRACMCSVCVCARALLGMKSLLLVSLLICRVNLWNLVTAFQHGQCFKGRRLVLVVLEIRLKRYVSAAYTVYPYTRLLSCNRVYFIQDSFVQSHQRNWIHG